MTIKTISKTEDVLSLAVATFIADSITKATSIFSTTFNSGSTTTNIVQSAESSAERAKGGAVRLLVKNTLTVPVIGYDSTAGSIVVGPATEPMTVHTVVAVGKQTALTLANTSATMGPARETMCYLIAKAINDNVAMLNKGCTVVLPEDSNADLVTKVLSTTAPLTRGLVGLQPVDTFSGVYGA